MAINESILFTINSTNYTNAEPFTIYKPQAGNSGFVTTLRLTVDINSITEANFPYIPDDTPPNVIQQILDEVALNTEFREIILYVKKGTGAWSRAIPVKIFNKDPFYEVPLMRFFSDANTIDVAEDFSLGIRVKIGSVLTAADAITVYGFAVEEKKNDPTLEAFGDRLTALENLLGLFGAATSAAAGTNGLVKGAAAGEAAFLLRGDRTWQNPAAFATPAYIDNAILGLVAGAPGALNTLDELANALTDDANFATTVTNALASKVGITGTETISGAKTFSATEGLIVTNNLTVSGYLTQASRQFKGGASVSQSIPTSGTSETKLTLPEVTDSHNQYSNSRLTAVTAETWRISLFISFKVTTAPARTLVYIYKNGVGVAGLSRVFDSQLSAGDSSTPLITIPEISLVAGDYLEVFVQVTSGTVSVFGDVGMNATYWYGTRIR